jgi:hypothetical protein
MTSTHRWASIVAVSIIACSAVACSPSASTAQPASDAPVAKASASNASGSVPASEGPTLDLTEGLIAHYPFDGDVKDASGHGHDGALEAPVFVPDASGTADSALQFNGKDTMVEVADDSELNLTGSFTISMKVKGEADASHQWLLVSKHYVGQCQPGDTSWIFRFNKTGGGLFFTQYDHNASCGTHFGYGTDVPLDDGEWHAVAATFDKDSGTLTLYFDGTSVYSKVETLSFTGNHQPLVIGNQYMGPDSTNFAGAMDELRLYSRALTADEIRALASA